MASVYRPHGRKVYRVEFRNQHGEAQTVSTGMSDRRAAEQLGAKLEHDAQRLAAGLQPDYPQLTGRHLGLADVSGRETPIAAVLAEYLEDLGRRHKRKATVRNYRVTVALVAAACRWRTLADVTAESLRQYLARLSRDGRAAGTTNGYRAVVGTFLGWCVEQGYVADNAARRVRPASTAGARAYRRRAFAPDELRALLAAARRRRGLYLVAALTGLRGEEASLVEKRDFDLQAWVWSCRPEVDKKGRAWRLPLLPDLRPELGRLALALPEPTSRLFPRRVDEVTFRTDLGRARLAEVDAEGRHLSFHSLRYTFCTMLARRLPMAKVQRFMRHSDIRQTANTYTDLGLADLGADEQALADVFDPTAGPTGWEGGGRNAV